MLLKAKTIVLTGGCRGIGLACAQAYAAAGAALVILDLAAACPEDTARELGEGHLGVSCDVAREDEVAAALAEAMALRGQIDAIHNNVGIASPSKPLHETTDQEWNSLFSVNLKSILYTTRHGLAALQASHGNILNTSSLVGSIGQANHAAYAATKGGINALTKSMALDYARFGIRVNAVCPAGAWTPLLREWAAEQESPETVARYLNDIHALGYCPEPDVVADACVFLLSEQARFITGHLLPVSGGAELGYRRSASPEAGSEAK